ncbi:MAG: hypothetical protein OEZ44_05680 [Candidatus Bathyarchaeota archaeon]|nr:hypothetical protein [Candidatus Bathyarchaeota archaeon]
MDRLFRAVKGGLEADIIAVEGNPSVDITCLRSLKMVMQSGRIVHPSMY